MGTCERSATGGCAGLRARRKAGYCGSGRIQISTASTMAAAAKKIAAISHGPVGARRRRGATGSGIGSGRLGVASTIFGTASASDTIAARCSSKSSTDSRAGVAIACVAQSSRVARRPRAGEGVRARWILAQSARETRGTAHSRPSQRESARTSDPEGVRVPRRHSLLHRLRQVLPRTFRRLRPRLRRPRADTERARPEGRIRLLLGLALVAVG